MPWHSQAVFRFHWHQKGNKHLSLMKLPAFPSADCSFSGLGHSLQQLLPPAKRTHPDCASTTACMAAQQTDSAKKQSTSKIQFPKVIYYNVAWIAVQAQRKNKQSRGWEQAAQGMARPSWHQCPQDRGLSSQNGAPRTGDRQHFDLGKW